MWVVLWDKGVRAQPATGGAVEAHTRAAHPLGHQLLALGRDLIQQIVEHPVAAREEHEAEVRVTTAALATLL